MPRKNSTGNQENLDPNVAGLRAEVIGAAHHRDAGAKLYAVCDERHRLARHSGDRRLQALPPKASVHDVQNGAAHGPRTKSANIVGQTMKLNPHGDAAIYETMVRLAKGNEALLHPFVDSKGNFGKVYSRDMAYAASRYTEAKLAPICAELFRDIDADTVDFVDNYDGSMKEPTLLPTTFPNVLVSANTGIAVGMASNICGFNLAEVCRTAIAYPRPERTICWTRSRRRIFRPAARFCTTARDGRRSTDTGRGSVQGARHAGAMTKTKTYRNLRDPVHDDRRRPLWTRWPNWSRRARCERSADMRDETDLTGLKLTIDLKRGADPEKLMQKLFRHDAAVGQLRLQLQHPHRRHAARDGRARNSRRVDGVAHRMRPAQSLFPDCKKRRTSCTCCRASARFFSISTRPSASSARPSWRRRSCRTS